MNYKNILLIVMSNMLFSNLVQFGGELYIDAQSARSLGMGGYNVSYSPSANPALIKYLKNSYIYFSHKNKFSGLADVNTFSYKYSKKIGPISYPIGISLINRSIDDIPDTRNIKNIYGSIDYTKIKYITYNEIGFLVATNYSINNITLGFGVKPFFSSLAEYKSWGISSDIGAITSLINNKIELGLRLENILNFTKWNTGSIEIFIPKLIVNGQIQIKSFLFGIEGGTQIYDSYNLVYNSGIEFYNNKKNISFRLGLSNNNMYSFGIGIIMRVGSIDYAFSQKDNGKIFKPTHIMALGITLDDLNIIKDNISP